MVHSGFRIVQEEEVEATDMSKFDEVPEEFAPLDVRHVDEVLGTEEMKPKLWTASPGGRLGAHGHGQQEECYYVLDGEFEVRIGPPGDTERFEVGPGHFVAASPEVVREWENVGDDDGRVLVVSAPHVDDEAISEAELEARAAESDDWTERLE